MGQSRLVQRETEPDQDEPMSMRLTASPGRRRDFNTAREMAEVSTSLSRAIWAVTCEGEKGLPLCAPSCQGNGDSSSN